jgi:hypothetical protein
VFFYRWYRDACFFTDDILLIGESREKSKVGNLEYANTTSTQFGVNRVYKFSEKHTDISLEVKIQRIYHTTSLTFVVPRVHHTK